MDSHSVESPRRPLQRTPIPSDPHMTVPSPSAKGFSPTRLRSTSPLMPPPVVVPSVPLHNTAHANKSGTSREWSEVGFLTQRVVSLEDRLSSMESLLSKAVARVDSFSVELDVARRDRESAALRLGAVESAISTSMKHVRDMADRTLKHDEALASTKESIARNERLVAENRALQSKVDELHHFVLTVREKGDHDVATMRGHLAQAARLLQDYCRRQCDALSAEQLSRLDAFEKDRADVLQECHRISDGLREQTAALQEFRQLLATHDINLQDQSTKVHLMSEELRTVQRRLLSAVRHLSREPGHFLSADFVSQETVAPATPSTPPPLSSAKVVTSGAKSTTVALTEAADRSQTALSPNATDAAVGNRDVAIDQFIAELNFLSRHVDRRE